MPIMAIRTERVDYSRISLIGLENVFRELTPRGDFLVTACHRGIRRSRAAMSLLMQMGYPIANNPRIIPSVCYSDFLDNNFSVDQNGIMVPGKTDYPFQVLILFHDGGREEKDLVKKIRRILDVEARGVLHKLILAEVRDQEGLFGLA